VSRAFEHPVHVPVRFVLAGWATMCQAGSREERARCWEEMDKYRRAQALGWIRDVLAANPVERLAEEMEWGGARAGDPRQLSGRAGGPGPPGRCRFWKRRQESAWPAAGPGSEVACR
jgi:hypothetical protein